MTKRRTIHTERAIRGYAEYQAWKQLVDFLETNPPIPKILIYLSGWYPIFNHTRTSSKTIASRELIIKDRFPGFAVMERLTGKEDKDETV